ncbi:MAG TPA: molybdopterin cofactor-binding domain-containing protein [Armatimonadota bacterium]|nr:molybdopterin cofactor-binding domain-containing protein [Armatimonadota bacterium]
MKPRGADDSSKDECGGSGLTRREFLQAAGGVVVLFSIARPLEAGGGGSAPPTAVGDINAWLRIGQDGRITVFAPTPEVGQGLRTELAQLAAEELSAPLSSVDVILGDTDRVPADAGVSASSALSTIGAKVRQAAAEAREMVASMAAERWGVPRAGVVIEDGRAVLASDPETFVGLGELAGGRRLVRRLERPAPLKPAAEHTLVGRPAPAIDGPAYVRGKARFAGDVRLPDLTYAKVLRAPCLGAKLVRAETGVAAAQPGVIAVVQEDDFVGVVAVRPDLAERALRSIQATWEEGEHASIGSLYQDLRQSAELEQEIAVRGDVETALAGARQGYSASYRTPFAAHAPIEPHAAVASPQGERIVVYVGTERPFGHRTAVAEALGMPPEKVRVIVPAVGGAFGGKDGPDVAVDAARLARAVGRPVLLSQSRVEEMSWNYFRPAAVIDVRCGVTEKGEIAAWDADVFNCGSRGAEPPYAFPNQRVRVYRCNSPLPQGPWRGLGGSANAFAREVHLDYVASELGEDPVAVRLRHLRGDAGMERVVRAAAERYGWHDRRPPTGLGAGFACAADDGSCAAVVADVEVERASGQVRVRRVLVVQDGGLVVNPDNLRSQIEGAVVMGLGLALREAVRYEQGRILTGSFASYPVPTFREAPSVEIVVLPDPASPPRGGATATLCAIAPAVANALFDAVGKRLRELPLASVRLRAGT